MTYAELLEMVASELAPGLGLSGAEVEPGWDAYCSVSASASVYGTLAMVKVELALHSRQGTLRYTWEAHSGASLTMAIPTIRAALFDSAHAYGTLAALERIAAAWSR